MFVCPYYILAVMPLMYMALMLWVLRWAETPEEVLGGFIAVHLVLLVLGVLFFTTSVTIFMVGAATMLLFLVLWGSLN